MNFKSLFSSKTFWLAVVQALVGVVVVFTTAYPGVGALVIGKSILDVILRVLTDQPVSLG